jgi:hypothetical protein
LKVLSLTMSIEKANCLSSSAKVLTVSLMGSPPRPRPRLAYQGPRNSAIPYDTPL